MLSADFLRNSAMCALPESTMAVDGVDLSKSPFDCNTFMGRVRYFAWITDPRLSFVRKKQLLEARDLLHSYRCIYAFNIIHKFYIIMNTIIYIFILYFIMIWALTLNLVSLYLIHYFIYIYFHNDMGSDIKFCDPLLDTPYSGYCFCIV